MFPFEFFWLVFILLCEIIRIENILTLHHYFFQTYCFLLLFVITISSHHTFILLYIFTTFDPFTNQLVIQYFLYFVFTNLIISNHFVSSIRQLINCFGIGFYTFIWSEFHYFLTIIEFLSILILFIRYFNALLIHLLQIHVLIYFLFLRYVLFHLLIQTLEHSFMFIEIITEFIQLLLFELFQLNLFSLFFW